MAKFFKTAGIVVLILLVLVLLLTGIGRLLGGASPLSQFMQAALSPVDKLLGTDLFRTGAMTARELIAHFEVPRRKFVENTRRFRLYE